MDPVATNSIQLAQLVAQLDFPAVCVLVLYGLYRGWWVPGPIHREIVAGLRGQLDAKSQEANKWEANALRGLEIMAQVVKSIEQFDRRVALLSSPPPSVPSPSAPPEGNSRGEP